MRPVRPWRRTRAARVGRYWVRRSHGARVRGWPGRPRVRCRRCSRPYGRTPPPVLLRVRSRARARRAGSSDKRPPWTAPRRPAFPPSRRPWTAVGRIGPHGRQGQGLHQGLTPPLPPSTVTAPAYVFTSAVGNSDVAARKSGRIPTGGLVTATATAAAADPGGTAQAAPAEVRKAVWAGGIGTERRRGRADPASRRIAVAVARNPGLLRRLDHPGRADVRLGDLPAAIPERHAENPAERGVPVQRDLDCRAGAPAATGRSARPCGASSPRWRCSRSS